MAKVIGFNGKVARKQKQLVTTEDGRTKASALIHSNEWYSTHGEAFVNSVIEYTREHGTEEQKEEIELREKLGSIHEFRNSPLFSKRQASKFLRGKGVVYDYLMSNINKTNQAQA
jgi:hypothetical protein